MRRTALKFQLLGTGALAISDLAQLPTGLVQLESFNIVWESIQKSGTMGNPSGVDLPSL